MIKCPASEANGLGIVNSEKGNFLVVAVDIIVIVVVVVLTVIVIIFVVVVIDILCIQMFSCARM